MRIAVYAGTGMVGARVVAEASGRGHDVTALSRSGGAAPTAGDTRSGAEGGTVTAAVGNAADAGEVAEIAATHDVVVSAVGPSHADPDLRATDGVTWTYLSPAPAIAPGERTGRYAVGDDAPVGESISAEDFAVALVDEIERPAHTGRRFTVASA